MNLLRGMPQLLTGSGIESGANNSRLPDDCTLKLLKKDGETSLRTNVTVGEPSSTSSTRSRKSFVWSKRCWRRLEKARETRTQEIFDDKAFPSR